MMNIHQYFVKRNLCSIYLCSGLNKSLNIFISPTCVVPIFLMKQN